MFFSSRPKLHFFSFFLLLFVVGSIVLAGIFSRGLHAAAAVTNVQGAWKVVQSPSLGRHNNELTAVAAISKSDIWAVGSDFEGEDFLLIEHWNGTYWSIVSSPVVGVSLVAVTAVSANNVWAVGHANGNTQVLIEHWNGHRWSMVPGANLGSVSYSGLGAVTAISANNIWAVGSDSNGALIEHWDGTQWSVVAGANLGSVSYSGLGAMTAISANDIWAVGYDSNGTLTEYWNGSIWSVVPSPSPVAHSNIDLTGVTAVSSNDVWAVGSYFQAVSPYTKETLIEHWDGTTWTIINSPSPGGDDLLAGVVARSTDDVWAVGRYWDNVNWLYRSLVEHWDGTVWSFVQSANRHGAGNTELNAIAQVPGANDLWSVGDDETGSHYGSELTFTEHSV